MIASDRMTLQTITQPINAPVARVSSFILISVYVIVERRGLRQFRPTILKCRRD